MGAKQSTTSSSSSSNGHSSAMNGHRRLSPRTSSNFGDDDDNDNTCQPCFIFSTPFGQSRNNSSINDVMGSPMPDTPVHQRQMRMKYAQIYSSKYSGLEKEMGSSSSLLNSSYNGTANGDGRRAEVYEGPDAETRLNAKYQLMEVLGVGSTSTCHRCINRSDSMEYACKIIDKRLIEDRFQGMMDQFQTEIRALRSLNHPNIIQLLDVYITDEKIFIIMELMKGGELFDYVVQKGTLTEEEASRIVRNVTSALVYMHSKNIVHRDLKPENLLLRKLPQNSQESVQVKIIDFGLSKCMDEPFARSFLGTRGYLAPEMLQRRDYTEAVDTWALGVIVFVLLCGCLPFDDDSQTVPSDDLVRAKFVLRFPRWAKDLSASAKDLLAHLLDVNPMTRYTAEQTLQHPWVRGDTAHKSKLLSSPGRIKKSPILNKRAMNGKKNGSHANKNGRHQNHRSQQTPASPTAASSLERQLVRKTSI